MRTSKILAWLDTLQLPFPSTDLARDERAEPSAKRVKLSKEASSSRLPTPPYDMPPSPKKRSRTSQDVDDDKDDDGSVFSQNAADQTTPRAIQFRDRLKQHQDTYPPGSPSGTSSELSRPSSISNASSPTKQQRNAALQETGYKAFSFTLHEDWQPESLKQLKSDLEKINGGEKLIPVELKTQLPNVSDFTFFDEDHAPKTPPYRYPDPDFVSDILERAALCLSENEGESSWNFSVHGPILSWVFPSRSRSNLLHFRYCPAATIVHGFKPKNAPAQMVDFCIIARPQDESPEQIIIEDMCQYRPDKTINHTDWGNLNKDPIAISIETKKHGEGWSKAVHQIGTWHSAQWRSLRYERKCVPLSRINFLPGIIIQGHVWMFVATIQRNDRAILFHQVALGDTESKLGIFKLLVALQYLHRWIEGNYWPAFRQDILGIVE